MFYNNRYNDVEMKVYDDDLNENPYKHLTGDDYDDLNMLFIPDEYPLEDYWFISAFNEL